jgi:hypothetical protein
MVMEWLIVIAFLAGPLALLFGADSRKEFRR